MEIVKIWMWDTHVFEVTLSLDSLHHTVVSSTIFQSSLDLETY